MTFDRNAILGILDQCSQAFTFPMLDNGYVYLAATRLSLFRSDIDWGMVIEVFGFSPRSGLPDTSIYTFASKLHNRNTPEQYVNYAAYEKYLRNNPHNEFNTVFPVEEGPWQDDENVEIVSPNAKQVFIRGNSVEIPSVQEYERHGIILEEPPNVQVFELCRYLADVSRDNVLARPEERRISVLPEMQQILQLEEWTHPDVCGEEFPSKCSSFQQLAEVLVTGHAGLYKPDAPPNTHWRNWPEGGTL